MRKNLVINISLMLFAFLWEINGSFADNLKIPQDGPFKEYYANGSLMNEGFVKDGKLEGPNKIYFESGQLKLEGVYKNNKLEGPYKIYYESGKLSTEGVFKDDKNDGPYKEYYENGQLRLESGFKNNLQEGPYKSYSENGTLIDEGVFKDGKHEGPYTKYYQSGKLKEEGFTKNDKLDGIIKSYDENGMLAFEANYADGKQVTEINGHDQRKSQDLAGGIDGVVNEEENFLSKHPTLGKLFAWGMSREQIEGVLGQSLVLLQHNIYQGNFKMGEDAVSGNFIIGNAGLESIIVKLKLSKEALTNLFVNLKSTYGEPTGTNGLGMQWVRGSDEISFVGVGLEGDTVSGVLGLRLIRKAERDDKYGPHKVSIFSSLSLGISEKQFLENASYYLPKKQADGDHVPGSVFYGADIRFANFPASAVFIFFEDMLDRMMVVISGVSDQENALKEQSDTIVLFLKRIYGEPTSIVGGNPYWIDDKVGFWLGYNQDDKNFVVMWEPAEDLKARVNK